MATRLMAVTFDAPEPARVADFWAALLGRDVVETSLGPLVPGDDTQVGLRFAPSQVRKTGANRIHLHLTSTDHAHQQQTVVTALGLGASHFDAGQSPDEEHVVLADPGGNEFCVMEPDNAYLAGCGFLGEVACEGSREVGFFWSEALGWPLVWDQDQETAIQSPLGGTKVAWSGASPVPQTASTTQRFDLITTGTDTEVEAERLVSLGASRFKAADDGSGVISLTDPDGIEFRLLDEHA